MLSKSLRCTDGESIDNEGEIEVIILFLIIGNS